MTGERVPYAGIATRAIALAADVAIVQVIVFAVGAMLALVASMIGGFDLGTAAAIAGIAVWAGAVATYFVVFWSGVGQTPGMRMMDVRVMTPGGAPPGVARSIVRVIGLGFAIIPLFAGFLPVLIDDRRRGLHDFLADTVVLHGGAEPPPEPEPAASLSTGSPAVSGPAP